MDVRPVDLTAADGFALRATLYDAGARAAVLVAPAMGVRRRFYDAFARHLAERGRNVLTIDYRGIGESRPRSLRGFAATLADWGRLDAAAAIDWMARELSPSSLAYVGHSAGGQVTGLAPNVDRVDRFVLVAAQSGYWRHWPGLRAYGLGALWVAMPLIAHVVGFFPSRPLGLGSEDLPRGVALQWAQWGRHPEYLFGYVDPAPYARVTAPIYAWSLHGDHYAPRPAVDALVRYFTSAPVARRHVDERVGHFDFFRRGVGERYWDEIAEWLDGTRSP